MVRRAVIAVLAALACWGAVTEAVSAEAPLVAISGRVVDMRGRPIEGVHVGALPASSNGAFGGDANTDARGRYTLMQRPGRYRVSFDLCGVRDNYAPQYYPGVTTERRAEAVRVTLRHPRRGIDARMQTGGQITGRIVAIGLPRSRTVSSISVFVPFINDAYPYKYAQGDVVVTHPDQYRVACLPTGRYRVALTAQDATRSEPLYEDWYPGRPDPGRATWIAVRTDHVTRLATQHLHADVPVAGRVIDRSGHAPPSGFAYAGIPEPDGSFYTTAAGEFGPAESYVIDHVPPGVWHLTAESDLAQSPMRIVHVRAGARHAGGGTLRLGRPVTFHGAANLAHRRLTITGTLRPAAEVHVSVHDGNAVAFLGTRKVGPGRLRFVVALPRRFRTVSPDATVTLEISRPVTWIQLTLRVHAGPA